MAKQKNKRARVERRRARRAAKRREGKRNAMMHFVGGAGGADDGLYDDCPFCRAMRHAGIVPDGDGFGAATPAQQRAYEERLAEIIAAEGMPAGAVSLDEEGLMLRHAVAVRAMAVEGWPDEPWGLSPERRDAFFARYNELMRGEDLVTSN